MLGINLWRCLLGIGFDRQLAQVVQTSANRIPGVGARSQGQRALLLSSRWSLRAVKCHSKESDRAAPYAHRGFHSNLLPLFELESSQNIK